MLRMSILANTLLSGFRSEAHVTELDLSLELVPRTNLDGLTVTDAVTRFGHCGRYNRGWYSEW
eukprot:SAG11_NODE_1376_length_5086_cov_19.924804_5_plen_63_part_00